MVGGERGIGANSRIGEREVNGKGVVRKKKRDKKW